jgi:hypothetical protein
MTHVGHDGGGMDARYISSCVKRRIRLSRGIVTLGTDPSPPAQDDRLNHTFFIQCWKGVISVFTLKKTARLPKPRGNHSSRHPPRVAGIP